MSEHSDNNDIYRNQVKKMIGILAGDIRQGWGEQVDDRLDCIIKLSKMIGRNDWVVEIEANRDDINYDGRWMRDAWSGPYYVEKCTRENVGNDLYDEYIDEIGFLKSSSEESL
jgi:hypothetical protein